MSPILALLPLLFGLWLYAALLRFAARLQGRAQIGWLHAFGFATFVGVVAVLGRVVSHWRPKPTIASALLPLLVAAAAQVLVGGWYFSTRATTAEGHPLGWRRAVEVMALAVGLYGGGVLALFVILRTFASVVRR